MTEPMGGASTGGMLYDALTMAREAKGELDAHEQVCAERYLNIQTQMGDLKTGLADVKKILAWAGIFALTIIVGALSWSLQQQWTASKAQTENSALQIQLLRSQLQQQQQLPRVAIEQHQGPANVTQEPR